MARKFNQIRPRLWASRRFKALPSDDARYLFVHLLTGPHNNVAGAFCLPCAYLSADIGWAVEKVKAGISELAAGEMLAADDATEEIAIARWLQNCPPTNAKHRRGVVAAIDELESARLREIVAADLELVSPTEPETPANVTPISANLANSALMRRAGR